MSKKSIIPLLLIGAGAVYLINRQRTAPVAGLGSNLSTAAFAAQARAISSAMKNAVKKAEKAVAKDPSKLSKQPKWIQKVLKGKRAPPPPAGSLVEYQDENGNVITKAEYDRRSAEYEAQSACIANGGSWFGGACAMSMPGAPQPQAPDSDCVARGGTWMPAVGRTTSYCRAPSAPSAIQQAMAQAAQQSAPSAPSGGGGGPSESDYYAQQGASSAPSQQDAPMPSFADQAAAPAPTKMNPLIAVAAFAAVPLVMGLTGGK